METLRNSWHAFDPLMPLELEAGEAVRGEGSAWRTMWGYASQGTVSVTDRRLIFRARIPKFGNLERRRREVRFSSIKALKATKPALIERCLLLLRGEAWTSELTKVTVTAGEATLDEFFACATLVGQIADAVAARHDTLT